jgi:hypothetical protein
VWEHLLTLLAIYSMFGLLKGSMSFDDSVFWRMVLKFLVMASCCSGGCEGHLCLLEKKYKQLFEASKGTMLHYTRPF